MSRCLLILSCCIAATNARNNESPTLHVVAPVHAAITNASIEVMLNCFLAQTSRDWALTVVGDGYDARAAAVVGRYTDPRINYAATDRAYGDHGHSPRELGLGLGESPWTVLTGVDNYYVPLFVETVVDKIRANPDAGLVYYDFLLDMKGELAAGAAYDAALRAYGDAPAEDDPEAVIVRPLLDGRAAEIRFRRGDDVAAVARDFVAAEGLSSGGGCDDAVCVTDGAILSTLPVVSISIDQCPRRSRTSSRATWPRKLRVRPARRAKWGAAGRVRCHRTRATSTRRWTSRGVSTLAPLPYELTWRAASALGGATTRPTFRTSARCSKSSHASASRRSSSRRRFTSTTSEFL